jgi:hypothetical protein
VQSRAELERNSGQPSVASAAPGQKVFGVRRFIVAFVLLRVFRYLGLRRFIDTFFITKSGDESPHFKVIIWPFCLWRSGF